MAIRYEYLSHILDNATPTYGDEYTVKIGLSYEMAKGSVANESHISTTTHIGTHIDLPYHFFADGDTIESYEASSWIFTHPLLIELDHVGEIICDELIKKIEIYSNIEETDLIIVKTGIEKERGQKKFWAENPGFSPELYTYLTKKFPKLRAFGFDSISLSNYMHPLIGRKAHQAFLNPIRPLIIIEDMHLIHMLSTDNIIQVIIAPIRIAKCDGMPCTVIASIKSDSKNK